MIKISTKGNKAWVTFTYEPDVEAESVELAGDFNDWDAEPMKKKKNGEFYVTKVIPVGSVCHFRYKVDGVDWCNDPEAETSANNFGSENSVVKI